MRTRPSKISIEELKSFKLKEENEKLKKELETIKEENKKLKKNRRSRNRKQAESTN